MFDHLFYSINGFHYDLQTNLAGWRFVGWTGFLVVGAMITDYLRRNWRTLPHAFGVFIFGVALICFGFWPHQFFWWRHEDLIAKGRCNNPLDPVFNVVICDYRDWWYSWNVYVTPFAYVSAGAGFALMMLPLLRMSYGVSWLGAVVSAVSWLAVSYAAGIALAGI